MTKKLYKSSNKMISGVAAGIAEYLNVDPTIVRLIWAAAAIFTAGTVAVVAYIAGAILMPERPINPDIFDDIPNNNGNGFPPLQ